jgi:hypothetical protein
MARFFNTHGPCVPGWHYMLPAWERLPEIAELVGRQEYFLLHAPRQTGKSTLINTFADELRAQGTLALVANLEECQGITDVAHAEALWIAAITRAAESWLPEASHPPRPDPTVPAGARLSSWLTAWCVQRGPIGALLLDEADRVEGDAMLSLLRQVRGGFHVRQLDRFPRSIGLIGLRDLRDYVVEAKGEPVHRGSPFNIAERVTLRNFTREEVARLYTQHTADTGQRFTEDAVDAVMTWTAGQPFLVNALAKEATDRLVVDRARPVDPRVIEEAVRRLGRARVTHLDNLAERTKEARVARVLAAILLGESSHRVDRGSDDFQYCVDLGLVRAEPDVSVANPLYREVLLRTLADARQPDVPARSWVREGRLDVAGLLDAFFSWWSEHADALRASDHTPYREAVPHIVFLAWLQRIVNGGGVITREFALGRGRLDVLVTWGGERHAFEIKRVRPQESLKRVIDEGAAQLARYLDLLGLSHGTLLVFDTRGRSWGKRLWADRRRVGTLEIEVRGG